MTAARDYPRIVVPPPGPKARAIVERQDRFASTAYPKEYPLAVARGERAVVEDVDGNRFLDFMAGLPAPTPGPRHTNGMQRGHHTPIRLPPILCSRLLLE